MTKHAVTVSVMIRRLVTFSFLFILAVFNWVESDGASPLQDTLRIIVLQGDRGLNSTETRSETLFVVQVQDTNGPLAGARVTFKAPAAAGASGMFPNAATMITVTTDPSGIAEAKGFRPNNVAGPFDVTVTVENSRATATIAQTNIGPKGGSGKKWIAVILGAAGAGAALSLATGQKSSSPTPVPSSPTCPPSCAIQAGAPTVGPPG